MEKGTVKQFIKVRNRCGADFSKGSLNIYYCSLNYRLDERYIAAEFMERFVYARCCAKNCIKLKQIQNKQM